MGGVRQFLESASILTLQSQEGDACILRCSEGDIFYHNSGGFSWKWIIGVNPLPRGATIGELGYNHYPRNFGDDDILENLAMAIRKIVQHFVMYTSLL
jgi:hypothetical protein